VFVFAGLLLLAPLMALVATVLALGGHGPAGWAGGTLLLVAVAVAWRWCWRRCASWWRSTKAPETTTVRPHRLSGR
jgi:membrane protein implicated in regulation of membrane protease activity